MTVSYSIDTLKLTAHQLSDSVVEEREEKYQVMLQLLYVNINK